ncbi:MAG: TonB-dependent receptor [Chryseolinea sp.]
MTLRSLILFGLVLCCLVTAWGQDSCTSIFSGTIVDGAGKPVIGAAIVLLPQQHGQTSDDQGHFRFEKICKGAYTVKVQYLGYGDVQFDVAINSSLERRITIKETTTQLQTVVIQHHDAAHTENVTNFAQLDEKKIAESAGKTLGETLKEITGVNSIQTGPGIFKPVIHGVHSQRILILNHGIRQEGQQWGAEHAPEIDPFVASNIIVVKDASAIKYGADALGGTIIVNPPDLPEQGRLSGTVNTIYQSNNRSGTVSAMLEGGIGKLRGWGWRIQGTGKRGGDYKTPNYSLTNTGVKELNFSAAAGYHKERAGFDVYFSSFQTEIGILKGTSISNLDDLVDAMERPEPQYTSGFSYAIAAPRQTVSHSLLKLSGHLMTSHGEWRLQYGFQNDHRREYDLRVGDLSYIPAIDLNLYTHTLDAEWEKLHRGPWSLTLGINSMLQDNENVPGTKRIPFIPNFLSETGGVFAVTKLQLEKWSIDLGLRYDYRHYSVKGYDFKNTLYAKSFEFNNVSGTAGATLKIDDTQTLRLNLSSAWRPPHVSELFSLGTHQSAAAIEYGLLLNDSTNEIMDFNDVHFKIEKALKFVTAYERTWNRLSIEVSPYLNYIFNYTYLRPVGLTKNVRGTYPYFRYAQTDALFLGVDASASWQLFNELKISASASLLKVSDETHHDYLVFIPSNRFDLTFRYERPVAGFGKHFYAESKFKYIEKQTRSPRVVTVREIKEAEEQGLDPFNGDSSNFDFMAAPNGYFLLNLAAGISVKGGKAQYDFRMASDNTLNQVYREYTNRFRYYADEPGRNITISVKCIF